ncbi:MAG: glycine/betaine ABC transporter substrate-binding protein [Actinomycetota bacterium]|nr:glycine/betaine ABC transporter substrate-binding protein [Actinomycetota bacterium]
MTLTSARLRPLLGVALAATLALAACADSDPSTVETDPGAEGGAEEQATVFRFQPLEPGAVTVTALEQGDIDLAVLFSTVGAIAANDWVVLDDDQGLQGSENITPLVRTDTVDEGAIAVLDEVSAALTTEAITELNQRVDGDKEDPADVARDFLEAEGLLEVDDPQGSGALTVGSANFTESTIVANLYAEALRANGYDVTIEANLGSREQVTYPSLVSGELDIVPEYLQSLLAFLDPEAESVTPEEGVARIEELLPEPLTLAEPSSAQDQNALVVTRETAEQYGLEAVSDLAEVEDPLVLGGPPECPERPLCLPGYEAVYGLDFDA